MLIEMKLDLEEAEQTPTNKISGFSERLQELMPSLFEHECSENEPGGFFARVQEGTWMGHVAEHIALELQSLAGMDCGYGRTRSTEKKGVYHVVIACEIPNAGIYAAKAAVRIVQALMSTNPYDVEEDIKELRKICAEEGLPESLKAIQKEAKKRNIPAKQLYDRSMLQLGQGCNLYNLSAFDSEQLTDPMQLEPDFQRIKIILQKSQIPLLESYSISSEADVTGAVSELGYPVRIVPVKRNSPEIPGAIAYNFQDAIQQFRIARTIADKVLIEQQPEGKIFKFILVNHKVISIANRLDSGEYLPISKLELSESHIFQAERIARLAGYKVCTIELLMEDPLRQTEDSNGIVIRVNEGVNIEPTSFFALQSFPLIAEAILKMIYPPGKSGRIPVVAVTGTNGKTTTTRLTAHLAKRAGHIVGYTSTDGVFIQDKCIGEGDCSGPASAELILSDSAVQLAVLECARGGILRSGLGFDKCSISIITNITEDHLGLEDINSLKDLTKVKSVIAHSTDPDGYAILNADDDNVYSIKHELDCHIALFGMEMNDRLKRHMQMGGMVAYVEDEYFTVCHHGCKTQIAKVNDVPLTLNGRAECMVMNILPCLLASIIQNFGIANIREGLETFVPGPELTPGRFNIFSFNDFDVMVDYAHNADGLIELGKFLRKTPASIKIGIITSPGDRRIEDIRNIGYYAAQFFDEIIIRHDKDCRGRTPDQITKLLREGIRQVSSSLKIKVISNELDALHYAMDHARQGAFIVLCSEDVKNSILDIEMALNAEKATRISVPA
jgi:UDP-N-acetylmuramyl tripeptide synthase